MTKIAVTAGAPAPAVDFRLWQEAVNGAISSDDPEALAKLRQKLEILEARQLVMLKANAIMGELPPHLRPAALAKLGFSDYDSQALLNNPFGPGFTRQAIANNEAKIRATQDRIARLERERQAESSESRGPGYLLREDVGQNRIMFLFDEKPEASVRDLLKSHGFKWSPTRKAWVRMLNDNGRFAAGTVRARLNALASA